jgi:hypothetical protein
VVTTVLVPIYPDYLSEQLPLEPSILADFKWSQSYRENND